MAVPKSQRAKTPLTVLTELDALISYTIQLCTDERRFPKRYRWCLTKDIIDSAIKAKADAARANSVYVSDRESAMLRRTYQQKAIANLAALGTLMDTAFKVFSGLRHLDEEKPKKHANIATWTARYDKTKALMLAWKKSDTEHARKYMG